MTERSLSIHKNNQVPVDICVVGGAGHVGLPLSIVFAAQKQRVLIYDLNQNWMEVLRGGLMPFMEQNAEPLLKNALSKGLLSFTNQAEHVATAKTVVLTIG